MDTTDTKSIIDDVSLKDHFNNFMSSIFLYGIIFIVITFNLVAMSVSLHVNIDKPFSKKFGSAIFAFMFGLIYIVFNYYLYYIMKKKKTVKLYTTGKMFPWY
jgi:hypothetical protein